MANLPECIRCGDYLNWGYCLCFNCSSEVYRWIGDVLEKGLTEDLIGEGKKHLRNYEHLLEEDADSFQP